MRGSQIRVAVGEPSAPTLLPSLSSEPPQPRPARRDKGSGPGNSSERVFSRIWSGSGRPGQKGSSGGHRTQSRDSSGEEWGVGAGWCRSALCPPDGDLVQAPHTRGPRFLLCSRGTMAKCRAVHPDPAPLLVKGQELEPGHPPGQQGDCFSCWVEGGRRTCWRNEPCLSPPLLQSVASFVLPPGKGRHVF